jgi:hypothetical protein
MQIKKLLLTTITLSTLLMAENVNDNNTSMDLDFKSGGTWTVLPYVFSTETTGFSGGVGAIVQGLLQPHTTMVATLYGGAEQDIITNGEPDTASFAGGLFGFYNLRIPYTERFFFSTLAYISQIPMQRLYFDSTNNSNKDDALISSGDNDFASAYFTYVLPMGEGITNPENRFNLKDGFAMGRESYGNGKPFVSGRTVLGLTAFDQHQTINNTEGISPTTPAIWDSNGMRLFLAHNNTDYSYNPSRGYSFNLQYSKDFGKGDSLQSWDFIEFKTSKYYNLETFSFTQQNVLAMNFWTGYSPSWEINNQSFPGIDAHSTPLYEGPRLGGFFRMRGYNQNRFLDKAAIYATAEYRAILDYNPIKSGAWGEWLQKNLPLDWIQVVGFAEAGRVNDTYNAELLQDVKFDVGLGLRAMVAELPLRFDVAYSDEGVNMWVMVNQPFTY